MHQLAAEYSLKELQPLIFSFLEVEVIPIIGGIFLTHRRYIRDLLERTRMEGAKKLATPLSTIIKLRWFPSS